MCSELLAVEIGERFRSPPHGAIGGFPDTFSFCRGYTFVAMKAEEIMCRNVRCVSPDTTLVEIAEQMLKLDVGALPVCDHDRIAGMVTDRDIVIRAIAMGKNPAVARVSDVMTEGIVYGFSDQDVDEISRIMEEHQIRRLPILDRNKRLVGLIATADVALHAESKVTGEILKCVSTPAELKAS